MSNIKLPDWAVDAWEPKRYWALFGGRGSAKSHTMARAAVILGRQKKLRILCGREFQNSIKDSVHQLLSNVIKEYGLGDEGEKFYKVTDREIRGKNGTLITFTGLRNNIESIKSMEAINICWVTEARTISADSLEKLTPTIRAPNSEIWFDWNPELASDPIDVMFRGVDGAPPRSIVREVNFWDNPWFPEPLQEEMEYDKRRDPEKYAHVWCGKYKKNSEARVFKNWRIGTNEEVDAARAQATRFHQGADWGFSVDPTVLVRSFYVNRTLYVDDEAYAVGCEIDYIPALFAGDWDKKITGHKWENPKGYKGIPDSYKWPITADSARPDTIAYMQKRGFNIKAAAKGSGSVEDGIEFLQSFDIVVRPKCIHTIDELSFYSWKTDPKTKEILPVLEDKNNHVIDSLRYSAEGIRRGTYTLANL